MNLKCKFLLIIMTRGYIYFVIENWCFESKNIYKFSCLNLYNINKQTQKKVGLMAIC